ncbi:hypothetical protein H4R18_004156 [Coemansia javaensis]|uniref:Mitochondrial carrier n=1 Tax=Coemansia javaensis TaxID=2761396 RepID=A0A9W8H9U3_9FUNG|nr:hypothetical protein H4R18_004156 [Coemansia javaensis]
MSAAEGGDAAAPPPPLTRKQAGAVGATASAVRGLLLQPLYLWYRTPLKLFRPLRVDYLATARALLPPDVLSRRVSLRGSTLGMIANAVRQRGWSFLPRYVLQPMLANWMVGFALFTTYAATLPAAYARAASQYSLSSHERLPWHPPFAAGAAAGLAQSVVATPLDSLRVRFEVEDMVRGRYKSWWEFATASASEMSLGGLYRGLRLTLAKDVVGYCLFFGLFELAKNEAIGLHRDLVRAACRADLLGPGSEIGRLTRARAAELRRLLDREPERAESSGGWLPKSSHALVLPVLLLPPALGRPVCILLAGCAAALAYQAVDYPLERFRTLLYSEVANSEMVRSSVARHFADDSSHGSRRAPGPAPTPYRDAWGSLVNAAAREHPYPAHSAVGRTLRAGRYLYRGWLGVSLRSIPAASVGLLAYELLKPSLLPGPA